MLFIFEEVRNCLELLQRAGGREYYKFILIHYKISMKKNQYNSAMVK